MIWASALLDRIQPRSLDLVSPLEHEKCLEQLHFSLIGNPEFEGKVTDRDAVVREKGRQPNDLNVDLRAFFQARGLSTDIRCLPRLTLWAQLRIGFWAFVFAFVAWSQVADTEWALGLTPWREPIHLLITASAAFGSGLYVYWIFRRRSGRLVEFVAKATKAQPNQRPISRPIVE